MKDMKLIVVILSVAFLLLPNLERVALAEETETRYYAKVMEENIYLYSNPFDSSENLLFELPKSYFVILTGKAENDFYIAQYNGVIGYVKRDQVSPMNGTPQTPFAQSTFRVYDMDGLEMFSIPSYSDENFVTTVPYLSENLTYYGSITGQVAVPEKSGEWYYCAYSDGERSFRGYLYSVFCDKLTEIVENTESFPLITDELFPEPSSSIGSLSPTAQVFIILAISLPCAFILYLLIRPTLASKSGIKREKKGKFKRKGKCDYFEFDEKDLG